MFAQPLQDAAQDQARTGGRQWRDEPIVGHRLDNGYMVVHAVGQPCRYCDDDAAAMQSR